MAFAEYEKYDALGLADLVRKKKISPRELVDEAIARAEQLNPKLNAIVYKAYDDARAVAKTAKPTGLFAGVPMFLKDMRGGATGMPTRTMSAATSAALVCALSSFCALASVRAAASAARTVLTAFTVSEPTSVLTAATAWLRNVAGP